MDRQQFIVLLRAEKGLRCSSGSPTPRTRAARLARRFGYGEKHLGRLVLIRALIDTAGLSKASAREVIAAVNAVTGTAVYEPVVPALWRLAHKELAEERLHNSSVVRPRGCGGHWVKLAQDSRNFSAM
jgi:hypothetical protein